MLSRYSVPNGYNLIVWGGYGAAERKEVAVCPDFYSFETDEEFNSALDISVVKCTNTAGKSLTHRDYLGALMSLGIDRSVTGDILVNESEAYLFVQSTMADYITANMPKVSNCRMEYSVLNSVSGDEIERFLPKTKEKVIIVPSLRLDCLLSETYSLSRSEASELIKNGCVRVDYVDCDRCDRKVTEGNLISVTGKGRFYFSEIIGQTKKESLKVNVLIYI